MDKHKKEENDLLLKSLLLKYRQGTLTEKEKKVLEMLENDFRHNQKIRMKDSKTESEKRIRAFLEEKTGIHIAKDEPAIETNEIYLPERKRRHSLFVPIFTTGAAAAVLFLLFFSVMRYTQSGTMDDTQEILALAERHVSGDAMKTLTLADGSVVYMNMGSSISLYKGKFDDETRELWLDEGEAFFEVAKDPDRPFIVHTPDGVSTRVLGTSFNIKAYPELGEQVISVKTGKVEVTEKNGKKLQLLPGDKAGYDTVSGVLMVGLTSKDAIAGWRNGRLTLDKAGIKELSLRIKQLYGKKVVVLNNALPADLQLMTDYPASIGIENIAENIAAIFGIHSRTTEEELIFY